MGIGILIVAFILAIFMTKKAKNFMVRFFSIIWYTIVLFFVIGFILLLSGNL